MYLFKNSYSAVAIQRLIHAVQIFLEKLTETEYSFVLQYARNEMVDIYLSLVVFALCYECAKVSLYSSLSSDLRSQILIEIQVDQFSLDLSVMYRQTAVKICVSSDESAMIDAVNELSRYSRLEILLCLSR